MHALRTLLLSSVLLALPIGAAQAQVAGSAWEIVGLKLGMTADQANAALHAYNAAILTTTSYEVNDQGNTVNPIELFKGDDDATPKFKAPVEIIGVLFSHLFGQLGAEVSPNSDTPIYGATGEWFRLDFSPTDDGGRLYQIERTVTYPSSGDAAASMPEVATLESSVVAKYGKPADAENSYDSWMTDVRGRPLSSSSRDFRRCSTGIGELNVKGPVISQLDSAAGERLFTFKDIALALSSTNGATLDIHQQLPASSVFANLELVPPLLDESTDPSERARYKQCGVQLLFHYDAVGGAHVADFTMVLSDENAAFFDSGRAKFAKDKLAAANAGQAPATVKF